MAQSYLAALRGDHQTAEKAFIESEDLWAKTNEPVTLAYAKAVLAVVLGPENEFGATKLSEAKEFFEEHGMKGHREGIMSRAPRAPAGGAD